MEDNHHAQTINCTCLAPITNGIKHSGSIACVNLCIKTYTANTGFILESDMILFLVRLSQCWHYREHQHIESEWSKCSRHILSVIYLAHAPKWSNMQVIHIWTWHDEEEWKLTKEEFGKTMVTHTHTCRANHISTQWDFSLCCPFQCFILLLISTWQLT